MVQLAPAASAAQFVVTWKWLSLLTGVPIVAGAEPVFVTVITCSVAPAPGTLRKNNEAGRKEMPGSALPNPVSADVTFPAEVERVILPLRIPVVVGENCTATEQLSPTCNVPPQAVPPVAAALCAKSPLNIADDVVIAAVEALVSVKMVAPVVLPTGMVPKSNAEGESNAPVKGVPVPLSMRFRAEPPLVEEMLSVAVSAPVCDGRNCTPR